MDKKKGLINITTSILFKVVLLISNILVRRFLIRYIGNEINGLNSLYISVLDFLAVAELGVGSAISFCMYKPIVEGDSDKVAALYNLFTKLYLIIGGIILVAGCAIMPALPYLAKDYQNADVNLYFTFGLMLISVVLSYVFSAKTSLINAYKNNFITTTITSSGQLLQHGLQMIVLVFTQSFAWFLACRIFGVAVQWVVTEIVTRIKYRNIITNKQKVDDKTKKEVTRNVKAMFMHKIGSVLVNTADSMIISAFIGIVILGKYSNYTAIMAAMMSILCLCFTPLTSVIGHMFIEDDKESAYRYLRFFYTFNFILGLIFYLGYYAVIDNLVTVLFGDELELAKSVSFVITLNYFIQFMRQATLLFKDATGTFYYDRWKPLIEGVINIGLSIGFVYLFKYLWGEDFAVVGVIVATIITNLFICHVVEPYVLYKHALKVSPKNYYIRNYIYIAIFAGVLIALNYSMIVSDNQWVELFSNGGISLAFSIPISAIVILCNKDFRFYFKSFLNKIHRNKPATAEVDMESKNSQLNDEVNDTDANNSELKEENNIESTSDLL